MGCVSRALLPHRTMRSVSSISRYELVAPPAPNTVVRPTTLGEVVHLIRRLRATEEAEGRGSLRVDRLLESSGRPVESLVPRRGAKSSMVADQRLGQPLVAMLHRNLPGPPARPPAARRRRLRVPFGMRDGPPRGGRLSFAGISRTGDARAPRDAAPNRTPVDRDPSRRRCLGGRRDLRGPDAADPRGPSAEARNEDPGGPRRSARGRRARRVRAPEDGSQARLSPDPAAPELPGGRGALGRPPRAGPPARPRLGHRPGGGPWNSREGDLPTPRHLFSERSLQDAGHRASRRVRDRSLQGGKSMTRQTAILTAILAICGVPVAAAEEARDPNALPAPSWGGEIRLHAGGINGDPGIGGTGGPFDTRFSLDAPLARGLRLFGEVGTGGYQGEDDAGLHQLYFSYEHGDEKPVSVRAGYIPVPFGRWDAVTLSRPLIKDYEFTVGAGDEFVLRRASPGVGFHAAAGLFETDLALVDQTSTPRFAVERGDGRDAVARFGLRGGAFSAGVSVLSGLRPGAVAISGGESAEIRSRGVDLQWSRGPFSVGGEAVVVDLAGSRNAG